MQIILATRVVSLNKCVLQEHKTHSMTLTSKNLSFFYTVTKAILQEEFQVAGPRPSVKRITDHSWFYLKIEAVIKAEPLTIQSKECHSSIEKIMCPFSKLHYMGKFSLYRHVKVLQWYCKVFPVA